MFSGIPMDSFLAHICEHRPLLNSAGQQLSRQVPVSAWEEPQGTRAQHAATIVALDNGNDAFKGAMLHATEAQICTRRIITAYVPARTIRAGEGVTTWQVNGSETFQIGTDALSTPHTESLPVGGTVERLADPRLRHFLCACLVELLIAAGYTQSGEAYQGEHQLYASLGIPNEELDLQGLVEPTRLAIRSLLHIPWTVRRTDEQGKVTIWVLRLLEIIPYPQTFASFAAWYYTPSGTPVVTDIERHVTLDIGGGQLHECAVTLLHQTGGRPKLRMSASLLGDGTIAIARSAREVLRARFPALHLSDAEAQQMLTGGTVTIDGRRTNISEVIADVIATRARNLFTQMLPLLQEGQAFLMFTGGGSVLLARHLAELLQTKRALHSFLFVPPDYASVLNAIGGYILAQAAAQRERIRQGNSSAGKARE